MKNPSTRKKPWGGEKEEITLQPKEDAARLPTAVRKTRKKNRLVQSDHGKIARDRWGFQGTQKKKTDHGRRRGSMVRKTRKGRKQPNEPVFLANSGRFLWAKRGSRNHGQWVNKKTPASPGKSGIKKGKRGQDYMAGGEPVSNGETSTYQKTKGDVVIYNRRKGGESFQWKKRERNSQLLGHSDKVQIHRTGRLKKRKLMKQKKVKPGTITWGESKIQPQPRRAKWVATSDRPKKNARGPIQPKEGKLQLCKGSCGEHIW